MPFSVFEERAVFPGRDTATQVFKSPVETDESSLRPWLATTPRPSVLLQASRLCPCPRLIFFSLGNAKL